MQSVPAVQPPAVSVAERVRRFRLPPRVVLFGAPALALAAIAVGLATQFAYTERSDDADWRGFLIAVSLFAASAAVMGLGRPLPAPDTSLDDDSRDGALPAADAVAPGTFVLSKRWEYGLFAGVMALAAFFRLWQFFDFPQGLWYDEAVNGSDAVYILDQEHFTVWRETVQGRSTLYLYLLAGAFKLFGFNVFAFRIVPAVAGISAVFAFYFLARWLVGAVPALIATALLACGRWAVTFSRISWEAALVPLLATTSAFFLVRALETRNRFYYFLAGGSLAAGLYTHVSFRIVPVAMASILLYVAVAEWRLLRRDVAGLALYAASFLVVVFPLAQFAVTHQDQVLARTREVNVFREIDDVGSWEPLRFNVESSIRMMNIAGDRNGRHNLNDNRVFDNVAFGSPMLDEITAVLLVLGLAAGIWSFRNWRKGMVPVWFLLALVPGALSITIENPSAIRDIGAIPPLYLLVGLAVATLYRSLSPSRPGLYLFAAVSAVLVAGSIAINYYDLFRRQANDQYVYEGFTPEFTQIGELLADEGSDQSFMISREFSSHPAIHVLGHDELFTDYTPATNLNLPDGDLPAALIVDERSLGILPTLRKLYPGVTQDDHIDPYGRLFWSKLTIPAEDIASLHELPVSVTRGGVPVAGAPTRARLDHAWTAEDLADGPIDVTWRGHYWGGGNITDWSFALTAPGNAVLAIDGQEFGGDRQVTTQPIGLVPGEHDVTVTARIADPGALTLSVTPSFPGGPIGADALYATSVGDHGFRTVYRRGDTFGGEPVAIARMPFAIPADGFGDARLVEYQAVFDVSDAGTYGFALDGWNSAQLFIDEQLVVDNGGSHPAQRTDGFVDLDPGQHLIAIQYVATGHPMWALYMAGPDGQWARLDGSEFDVPPEDYRPPATVQLQADEAWGAGGRTFDEVGAIRSLAIAPDGNLVVASPDRISVITPDGTVLRTFDGGVQSIIDIAVSAQGEIVALDTESLSLPVFAPDGSHLRTMEGVIGSAGGLTVAGDRALIASPAGGFVISVPLAGGDGEPLPMSAEGLDGRARQPSDVVQGADGALYVTDFETRRVVVSPDGVSISVEFAGVTGGGSELPRLAVYRGLLFLADPIGQRVLLYERATGRQRGGQSLPGVVDARPMGIAVSSDGFVYVADAHEGRVYKLRIDAPEELLGQ